LFVSYNTKTSGGAREGLLDAFLRRYFSDDDPPRIKSGEDFRERAKKLVGGDKVARRSHTTGANLGAVMGVFEVSMSDDDTRTSGAIRRGRTICLARAGRPGPLRFSGG